MLLEVTKLNIIVVIITFTIVCLIGIIGYLMFMYVKSKDKYYSQKREYLRRANQISMIEYQYKNYKEGLNAHTVLRNIGEILHK